MSTLEKIYEIIAAELAVDPSTLSEDTNLKEQLDSLGIAQILFATEDAFEITIPTDEALTLETVGQFKDFVDKLIAAK